MSEVVIDLIGKDNASGAIKSNIESLGSLKDAVLDVAKAYGIYSAARAAFDLAKDAALYAAQVQMQGVALDVVGKKAGYAKAELDGYVSSLNKQGITVKEATSNLTRMVQAHLDLASASGLARVAQDAAVIATENSSQAFEGILHGIVTLQPEVIKMHGLTVNLQQAESDFAKENHRTVVSLSMHEKQQIALNEVMKSGKDIAGTYEAAMGTVGKQIFSLGRVVDDAKLAVGDGLKPILEEIVPVVTDFFKALRDDDESIKTIGKTAIFATQAFAGLVATTYEGTGLLMKAYSLLDAVGAVKTALGQKNAADLYSIWESGERATDFADKIALVVGCLETASDDLGNYSSKAKKATEDTASTQAKAAREAKAAQDKAAADAKVAAEQQIAEDKAFLDLDNKYKKEELTGFAKFAEDVEQNFEKKIEELEKKGAVDYKKFNEDKTRILKDELAKRVKVEQDAKDKDIKAAFGKGYDNSKDWTDFGAAGKMAKDLAAFDKETREKLEKIKEAHGITQQEINDIYKDRMAERLNIVRAGDVAIAAEVKASNAAVLTDIYQLTGIMTEQYIKVEKERIKAKYEADTKYLKSLAQIRTLTFAEQTAQDRLSQNEKNDLDELDQKLERNKESYTQMGNAAVEAGQKGAAAAAQVAGGSPSGGGGSPSGGGGGGSSFFDDMNRMLGPMPSGGTVGGGGGGNGGWGNTSFPPSQSSWPRSNVGGSGGGTTNNTDMTNTMAFNIYAYAINEASGKSFARQIYDWLLDDLKHGRIPEFSKGSA